jgi:hypothetical protein
VSASLKRVQSTTSFQSQVFWKFFETFVSLFRLLARMLRTYSLRVQKYHLIHYFKLFLIFFLLYSVTTFIVKTLLTAQFFCWALYNIKR